MNFMNYLLTRGLKFTILSITITLLFSFHVIGQVISNPTVLNSMSITNLSPTSATINWMYRDNEFDSAPAHLLYSRTSSQTFFNGIASKIVNFQGPSQIVKSEFINVTGLQPNTTYSWFLVVNDEAKGLSEPLLTEKCNNGVFLGYTFLTTSTYQLITFTTPNADGTGGAAAVTTTVSGSTIPPNQLPVANAGADINITLPVNSTTLNGLGSTDVDGCIASYEWAKVAGPNRFTFNQWWTATPTVSNLAQGTYTFRLRIRDSRGGFSEDFVNVVVDGGTVSQLPVANAGADQTITLPTNSVTLNGSGSSDPDGTLTLYVWTKIVGPSTYGLTGVNSAIANLNNLVQGTYSFQLTVTDNSGAMASDIVNITVNPAVNPPGCTIDGFESNNTASTAAAINVGTTIQAKICPLTDVDFFKFNNRNAQRNIRVTLSKLPTNYTLELFAPNGTLVGTSNAANTQNKIIVFNTTTVGTYSIKVAAGTGAIVNNSTYSLLAETSKNAFAQSTGSLVGESGNTDKAAILKNEAIFAVNVYPNPANDIINLTVPTDEFSYNILIFNQLGQVVKSLIAQDNLTTIRVADLNQGIYLVKVISDSGEIFTKKIVISK